MLQALNWTNWNGEKQANNALRTTGKLFSISQVKSLYLDPKPFPKERVIDADQNAAMFKRTVTSQKSFSSIPSIKSENKTENCHVYPHSAIDLSKVSTSLTWCAKNSMRI